ncbi:MAG TPA: metal ABC transporter substrate-binding protein [Anaeromyxobacter sp.]|nr:metal ABC transporter substrate-binding protein [Anaeromyxobacter sp.]
MTVPKSFAMLRSIVGPLAMAALAAATPSPARAALHVVTTVEGLAALVGEVGGDRVSVESLSKGVSDPHFVDANPMLAVKLRNASLLVDVGLELEIGWLPPLVTQARNPDIRPGEKGRLTAASAIQVLDVPTGPVDRSMGDLHPQGNPHFLNDPRRGLEVAAAIAARLSELDPTGAATYRSRLEAFRGRLEERMAAWDKELAPFRGRKIFTQHRTLTYFLDYSGLVDAGEMEPRPGVPPPPSHLAELVEIARAQKVTEIVVENFYDAKSAEVVARHSGAKVVQIPGDVGGDPGARTYVDYVDEVVSRIVGGLRS